MAIVYTKVITEGPARGATVHICDDAYAGDSPEITARKRARMADNLNKARQLFAREAYQKMTARERLESIAAAEERNQARIALHRETERAARELNAERDQLICEYTDAENAAQDKIDEIFSRAISRRFADLAEENRQS